MLAVCNWCEQALEHRLSLPVAMQFSLGRKKHASLATSPAAAGNSGAAGTHKAPKQDQPSGDGDLRAAQQDSQRMMDDMSHDEVGCSSGSTKHSQQTCSWCRHACILPRKLHITAGLGLSLQAVSLLARQQHQLPLQQNNWTALHVSEYRLPAAFEIVPVLKLAACRKRLPGSSCWPS